MASPDQLLEKSRAVARYCMERGTLPDATFVTALAAAEGQTPLKRESKEYAALQVELNKAVSLLPHGLDAVYPRHRVTKFGTLVFGTVLLVACAALTTWQGRMSGIIAEIDKSKVVVQDNNVVALYPVLKSLEAGENPFADITSQASIDLRGRLNDIQNKQQEILRDRARFSGLEGQAKTVLNAIAAFSPSLPSVNAATAGPASVETDAGSAPKATPLAIPAGAGGADRPPADRACLVYAADGAELPKRPTSSFTFYDVVREQARVAAFLRCLFQVDGSTPASMQVSVVPARDFDPQLQTMRDLVESLSLWVLPMMYGALGAVIFHMRAFLDEDQPNPSPWLVWVRVWLGGFAGAAIGWFLLGGVKDVPLGALTLSFLVGYSISVFLSILDAFVKKIEDQAKP